MVGCSDAGAWLMGGQRGTSYARPMSRDRRGTRKARGSNRLDRNAQHDVDGKGDNEHAGLISDKEGDISSLHHEQSASTCTRAKKELERILKDCSSHHFLAASIASPFLHAMIFIRGVVTISFPSILNVAFLMMNVHTSSQLR